MKAKDAELLATAMTECYASNRGCNRLPIRMVVEVPKDKTGRVNAELVLLCMDHSATYISEGKILEDHMLVTDDKNLKMFGEYGL